MKLYRFSPILSKHELLEAAHYVAEELGVLAEKVSTKSLPVSTIKIFAHYTEEYKKILQLLGELGEKNFVTHTSSYVKLHKPLQHDGNDIHYLGVRIPDPYRGQVGCGDFIINEAYSKYGANILKRADNFVRKANGHTLEMLEFWHPDSDVLGYVLSEKSEWKEVDNIKD